MLELWLFIWDYKSVSLNTELDSIMWWIFFSFKKVARQSAIIYVFTETPPTLRSRKVERFMQNEAHLFWTELNRRICCCQWDHLCGRRYTIQLGNSSNRSNYSILVSTLKHVGLFTKFRACAFLATFAIVLYLCQYLHGQIVIFGKGLNFKIKVIKMI